MVTGCCHWIAQVEVSSYPFFLLALIGFLGACRHHKPAPHHFSRENFPLPIGHRVSYTVCGVHCVFPFLYLHCRHLQSMSQSILQCPNQFCRRSEPTLQPLPGAVGTSPTSPTCSTQPSVCAGHATAIRRRLDAAKRSIPRTFSRSPKHFPFCAGIDCAVPEPCPLHSMYVWR